MCSAGRTVLLLLAFPQRLPTHRTRRLQEAQTHSGPAQSQAHVCDAALTAAHPQPARCTEPVTPTLWAGPRDLGRRGPPPRPRGRFDVNLGRVSDKAARKQDQDPNREANASSHAPTARASQGHSTSKTPPWDAHRTFRLR